MAFYIYIYIYIYMGVTNAGNQSLRSSPVAYGWAIMGDICFAVSFRTLAGSSSGRIALFWFRFSNYFITPSMPISRKGMLG